MTKKEIKHFKKQIAKAARYRLMTDEEIFAHINELIDKIAVGIESLLEKQKATPKAQEKTPEEVQAILDRLNKIQQKFK